MLGVIGTLLGAGLRWVLGFLSGSTRRDDIRLGQNEAAIADQKKAIAAQDKLLRDNSRAPTRSETEKSLDDGTF